MPTRENKHLAMSVLIVFGMFGFFACLDVLSKGGCEAAHQADLQRIDAENKAWQKEQREKAEQEDIARAREIWDRQSHAR